MKKAKNLVALILALSFISPTLALVACEDEPTASLPQPPPSSSEVIDEERDESDGTETPAPPDETPQPPQPPQTPPPQSGSDNTGNSGNTSGSNGSGSAGNTNTDTVVKPTTTKAQYIRCTGDGVNLRAGAGTDYAVLGRAESGEHYAVVGKTGQWYKIYYKNKPAYLYASYGAVFTIEQSKNEKIESVISEGYKLLGVPYVYGAVRLHDGNGKLLSGFTAQKFDCSSLVQYIFYKGANKLLQVHTRLQVKQGKYVAPSDLQRGDCIFFTNESRKHLTGVERVGHVALYLGDNYILHTASDYARIEKISSYRWNFYIEARRFL